MAMRHSMVACLLLAGVGTMGMARAQTMESPLSQCVSASASEADKRVLVRWLFSALAVHPDLAPMARVGDAERESIDRGMAALAQRLITVDCVQHVRALSVGQIQAAFESAFEALGRQAGISAMSHPAVEAANAKMANYLDEAAFQRMFETPPK